MRPERTVKPKYIFVTGGVVSSLGKGLAAASIGALLEARGLSEEIVVNLQGDEPLIHPSVIDAVAEPLIADPTVQMATAALPGEDPDEYARPSVVKVVTDDRGDALYFSRAPIPHYRDAGRGRYRKHLGIYGYRRAFLFRVAALPPAPLEEAERLEQLRVLQHGFRIRVVDVRYDSVGVDTPEDLRSVEERICGRKGR